MANWDDITNAGSNQSQMQADGATRSADAFVGTMKAESEAEAKITEATMLRETETQVRSTAVSSMKALTQFTREANA